MRIILFLFSVFFGVQLFAQDWQSNFAQTLQRAKVESKPVILVFAGSDWCAPCIKLDKSIWQSDEFVAYSQENLLLYKADFPRKKANKLSVQKQKENDDLAEKYNSKGYFPLVVALNSEGHVLGKIGYENVSANEYVGLLKKYFE
ncbi:MAG: thiol-disulfide isomerase [Pseudozobellia sp.]|nr:thiol-disulfide isomerase [Pseudozobellia sp.]MBG48662.1 thiol-disulfide isomerase [Pseudozobellia sp.]MBG50713.1 thiol-disulfide isomerase [Pseudozobellia sp.]|tara:strand:+ start:207 stop:641 length:435 start_codon:yes stop_codon:yes gene_type:complete